MKGLKSVLLLFISNLLLLSANAYILCPARPGPWSFHFQTGMGKYTAYQNNSANPFDFRYPWQAGLGVRRYLKRQSHVFFDAKLEKGRYSGYSYNSNNYWDIKSRTISLALSSGIKIPLKHQYSITAQMGLGMLRENSQRNSYQSPGEGAIEETFQSTHLSIPMNIALEKKISVYHSLGIYIQNQMVRDLWLKPSSLQNYFSAGIQLRVSILEFPYMNF